MTLVVAKMAEMKHTFSCYVLFGSSWEPSVWVCGQLVLKGEYRVSYHGETVHVSLREGKVLSSAKRTLEAMLQKQYFDANNIASLFITLALYNVLFLCARLMRGCGKAALALPRARVLRFQSAF